MCEKTEQICEGQGLSQAAFDVLAERRRQVEVEGWSAEHDDAHTGGQIAAAGMSYAMAVAVGPATAEIWWPWDEEWFKRAEPRRMLVKAAALLIAEIERLDRKAASEAEGRS